MPQSTKQKKQPTKYKGPEGEYLRVYDMPYGYVLGWTFPGLSGGLEQGALIDYAYGGDGSDAESQVVVNAVHKEPAVMAGIDPDAPHDAYSPLTFRTAKAARTALACANAALLAYEAKKPWPAWARQALAAGWTAPKGWKP